MRRTRKRVYKRKNYKKRERRRIRSVKKSRRKRKIQRGGNNDITQLVKNGKRSIVAYLTNFYADFTGNNAVSSPNPTFGQYEKF